MAKNVLITGGSGGIGSAIVREFAAHGYGVAFSYRTQKGRAQELEKELSATTFAKAYAADLTDTQQANDLVRAVLEDFSHVDVLVNCAGVSVSGLSQEMTDADYAAIFDGDVKSVFAVTRALLPHMIGRKTGAIVNLSSVWGVYGASCEVLYSAAKAAVDGMTKALAKEVGASGIRVNAVAPGWIETPMNARYSAEDKAAFAESVALCRVGTPEEVAHAVRFLAEATYVTGQILSVDGGML